MTWEVEGSRQRGRLKKTRHGKFSPVPKGCTV